LPWEDEDPHYENENCAERIMYRLKDQLFKRKTDICQSTKNKGTEAISKLFTVPRCYINASLFEIC